MAYPERRTISGDKRYKQRGIEGLSDISRRPHNIKYKKKVTSELEETILDLIHQKIWNMD